MGDKKLMILTELKTFRFYLPQDAGINLKREIYSIIKHDGLLVEHTIKMRLDKCIPNIRMKALLMNTRNIKTNES